ncbi:MAG: GNAT family N-acetyltransferase [Pseudomonadales bacterium]
MTDRSGTVTGQPIVYRTAHATDSAAIASLHAASWRYTYKGIFSQHYLEQQVDKDRLTYWERCLKASNPEREVILACRGVQLLGFICLIAEAHPVMGTIIDNLHVDIDTQRQGIARQLLHCGASWVLARQESPAIYLEVLAENHAAIAYYKRLGAAHRETNRWQTPGNGPIVEDLRYAWADAQLLLSPKG